MPTKVKQHYVPRFILRNFGLMGSDTQIGAFRIAEAKFLPRTSIKDQAHQNHFYEVQAIENWLEEVESAAAPVIARAVNHEVLPSRRTEEYRSLVKLAFLQSSRTPDAAGEANAMRKLLLEKMDPNGSAERGKLNAPATAMWGTLESLHVVHDLCCKLLCNRTEVPFVISDDPAVRYNQFLEEQGWTRMYIGIALRGFQLFLPLSPNTP